jgi:carbon-monoxide dehydrogenase large subunit
VLTHLKGIKSAPQYPLAMERAGRAGRRRRRRAHPRQAEDAIVPIGARVGSVTDPDPRSIRKRHHPSRARAISVSSACTLPAILTKASGCRCGDRNHSFGRHTGVCNEPRAIVADWDQASSASRPITARKRHT